MTPRVGCAVLAAGGSRRLGRPKQGDVGASGILRGERGISLLAWPGGALDIDTPEQLELAEES